MTDRVPLRAIVTGGVATGLAEMQAGDTVPVANGGTGATTGAGALVNLGLSSTDDLTEGTTNQWFTVARVRGTVLTGLSLATSTAIAAVDSVLAAFGKLQAQITNLGTSKADLASPALTGNPTAPTQASTDNSTRIATTAWAKFGFAALLSGAGYIKFPAWLGGVVFQWGTGTGGTYVTFPMAFPNGPYAITITPQAGGHAVLTYQGLDSNGFLPQGWNTSGAAANYFGTWIAVGR